MAVSDIYAVINGKPMNVYTEQQFFDNFQDLVSDDQAAVMVEKDGQQVILPIRQGYKSMDKPGAYPFGEGTDQHYAFLSFPTTEADKEAYCPDPDNIVNFKDADGIQALMSMTDKLNKSINQYLESDVGVGNIYRAPLKETDSPEMRGLKLALTEKHMEIDKYNERFGANWANDKRKLNDDNITMFLLKRMCKNFDINVDLVFTDQSSDVPNAMGKTITINLVPGIKDGSITTDE